MSLLLGTLFIVVCLLLIVVVLLQKGRGGGIGAAFGGAGGGAFGTRTGDVFTWITIGLTGAFLLLAVGVAIAFQQKGTVSVPGFNPPSQTGEGPTLVNITTVTPGATIYYTLDGTEPTPKSAEFKKDEPVSVDSDQTLRAQAFRPGFNPSVVQSRLYRSPVLLPETIAPPPGTMPAEQAQ